MVVLDDYADNPRGISLHDEWDKVKQQLNAANEVGLVVDVQRSRRLYLRLGTVEPDLFLGEVLLRGGGVGGGGEHG